MANRRIAHAVRVALLSAGATCAGLTGASVSAQEPLEEIIVTGSRIRVTDLDTARPVLVIDREGIVNQGFQNIADILQNLTTTGSPPLSRASPLSAGENAGGQAVDLRGLGTTRTLVLLDGKRLGISTSGVQDISPIPTAMIERVEVLKDGASSIYGSDAIGGVVNIITRKRFDGLQANAYVGHYEPSVGTVQKYDFILGQVGDRGALTMGAEWTREGQVSSLDRSFSATPRGRHIPNFGWTVAGQYGGWVSPAAEGLPGVTYVPPSATNPNQNTRIVLTEGGNPLNFADYRAQNVDGFSPQDKSNTNAQTDLRTPLERKTIFINGVYELTSSVEFHGSASYSNRVTTRTVAGYPYQAQPFDTPMSVDSYFNPLGSHHGYADPKEIVTWWRRTWEVPRVSDSDVSTLRFAGGLEGSLDFAGRGFHWDVGYMYNNNRQVQSTFGNLNLESVSQAVGPSFLNDVGVVQCGTPDDPILFGAQRGTCTPWNPFLAFGQVGPGGLTGNEDLMAFLFQEEHATGNTETQIYNANITGPIIDLPAGELSFALGIERREEKGRFVPDALAVTGGSTNLSARPTEGEYNVNEIYAELLVPVLAGMPGAEVLNLSLATRYSDYDTFGSTTNSKFGLEWRPVNQLLFRGNYAEGFRAPTISNLFSGGSQTFSFYTDPCDPQFGQSSTDATVAARCAADIADFASFRQLQQGFVPATQANAQTPVAFFGSAANPLLEPEESIGKSAGVVWRPEWDPISGLQLAVDWWTVKITNTIVADTPNLILDDCYVQGIASRCALFTRDASLGFVNSMNFGSRNAGYREIEGWDFDLSYRFDTGFGNFTINSQTTYLTKDELRSTDDPNVVPTEQIGFAASAGTTHRVRSVGSATWSMGDWGVTWGARYYSSLKESCLSNALFPEWCNMPGTKAPVPTQLRDNNKIGSHTFHDVQVRWEAPWNAVVAVGANNVFDRIGQQMYSQPNSNVSYNGEWDIGRFWYARYQHNF